MLETFLEVEFEDLSEDIRDKVEEGVKKRLNAINMVSLKILKGLS